MSPFNIMTKIRRACSDTQDYENRNYIGGKVDENWFDIQNKNGVREFVHSHGCLDALEFVPAGDILKPAGSKGPTKNFSRGNVYIKQYGACSWTGAH